MTEDGDKEAEVTENNSENESSSVVRKPFNPMLSYIEMVILIGVGYGLTGLFGFSAMIAVMLFGLVLLYRETLFVLNHYTYGFARKAAYFNAGHSSIYFVILFVNSYAITQSGIPLILPQIPGLTLICPLFIVMGLYGSANIRRMYQVQR